MRRGKQLLITLLVTVLALTQVVIVNAETVDSESPVISDVKILEYQNEYTDDDYIKVQIDATDNMGLWFARTYWKNVETGDVIELLPSENITSSVNASGYELKIPAKQFPAGKYVLISVTVLDGKYNAADKQLLESDQYTITVNSSNTGQGADYSKSPKIKSIELNSNTGSKNDDYVYKLKVEKGANDVDRIYISLRNVSNSSYPFVFEKSDVEGEYICNVNWSQQDCYYIDNIEFDNISIIDSSETTYQYVIKGEELYDYRIYPIEGVSREELSIKLNDVKKDTDAPELLEYSYDESTVYTPDIVKIHFKARDKTSIPVAVEYYITEENGDVQTYGPSGVYFDDVEEKQERTATTTLEFPRYDEGGKFYINEINVIDAAGNNAVYKIEDGTLEKKEFKVINNNEYDYMTSTSDPNLLDVIRQGTDANDGKIIVVNVDPLKPIAPKELFEIVSGKNVTVIFENVFDFDLSSGASDGGLQWIMKGDDIEKSKAKDINVYFYAEEAYHHLWVDRKQPSHEKPYPLYNLAGEVSDETEAELEAQLKKQLRDAGWGDVIPEIEAAREEGEYFVFALGRLYSEAYVRLEFADNGELPGKTTIRMKPKFLMRNWLNDYDMKLYYLSEEEENNGFDLVQDGIDKSKEGYYEFEITHNSEYGLLNDYYTLDENADTVGNENDNKGGNVTAVENNKDKSAKTGDDFNPFAVGLIGLGALLAGMLIILKQRKTS